MAMRVVECILVWFEEQKAENTEEAISHLARQFAALRATAVTDAGRRLSRRLQNLRVRHLELQVGRMQGEIQMQRVQLLWTASEARTYLAQLRAVLLAYRPGPAVTTPLPMPDASPTLGEHEFPDVAPVEDALEWDLGVREGTRRRLLDGLRDRMH
jgi:hypothetical protein